METLNQKVEEGNKKFTVLIAEDNKLQSQILEDLITPLGYKVIKAFDGEETLEKAFSNLPDLILLDVVMPKVDGYKICKVLKKDNKTWFIPIIIITSLNKLNDNIIAIKMGADDFLTKPFNEILLSARINSLIKVKSLNDQIAMHSVLLEQEVKERTSELQEAKNVTVFALAKLAECRDRETGEHLERIMNYSKIMAKELSTTEKFKKIITEEYIEMIYTSSSLHDIGKVGIPDRILLKPGKLTEEEFEIMKTHTMMGGDALAAAEKKIKGESFLKLAREIAYCHHEKFDGSGYPFGHKGGGIPISARIMALADVYDAMTSKRVYKNKFSHEVTRSFIIDNTENHFGPDVVQAFLNIENEFIKIKKFLNI
jgi:putative two-component system response regulator